MPGSFFDSNTLLHLAADPAKAARTRALLAQGGTISVQVLNEVANVALRKFRLTWPDTHELLATLRTLLTIHPVTIETHESALALAERHNLSLYDATIAAAALLAGCDTLWSEDMQHGMTLERRLRILNPYG